MVTWQPGRHDIARALASAASSVLTAPVGLTAMTVPLVFFGAAA
jgi:hypothetical protein